MPKKLLHGIDIAAPGGIGRLLDFHRKTFGDAVMEAGADNGGTAGAGEGGEQHGGFQPPSSQEELDRIINAAVARTHKKYEGFDDLKAKSGKVDEFQSRISELEATNSKLTEKVKGYDAEKERNALLSEVAKAKNVPADALRGSTREELEAHADQLAALLKPSGPVIPGQERQPGQISDSPEKEFVGALFGKN